MQRSQLACLALMLCGALGTIVSAAEPQAPAKAPPPPIRVVGDFCDRALVRDRGVVVIPIVFLSTSSDQWLAISISANEQLRDRLRLSAAQASDIVNVVDADTLALWHFDVTRDELARRAKLAKGDGKPAPGSKPVDPHARTPQKFPEDELLTYYDAKTERRLAAVLSAAQQDQLDLLYLNVEGLAALIRPHLSERLSITTSQYRKIKKLIQESVEEDGLNSARTLFTLNGKDTDAMHAIILRELRKAAARDDFAVMALLDEKQLETLAKIVTDAEPWEPLVVTPEMVYPPTLKQIEEAGKPR